MDTRVQQPFFARTYCWPCSVPRRGQDAETIVSISLANSTQDDPGKSFTLDLDAILSGEVNPESFPIYWLSFSCHYGD